MSIRGLLKAAVIAGPFSLAAGCTDSRGDIDPVRTGLAVGAGALVIGALDSRDDDHRDNDGWDRDHRDRHDRWDRPRYVEHYCGDGHYHPQCGGYYYR